MKNRTLSFILILAFVLSVVPQSLTTEAASKETVYVLTRMAGENAGFIDERYSYNKKGQVIKKSIKKGSYRSYNTYTYKKNRVKKVLHKNKKGKTFQKDLYTYDKKGRISLVKTYDHGAKDCFFYFSYNKKNQIIKCKQKYRSRVFNELRYTWKNNRISTIKWSKRGKYKNQYKYDKNGLITSYTTTNRKWGDTTYYTYKYEMENDRPVSCILTESDSDSSYAYDDNIVYEYKAIKINKKYVKQVKAQQLAIINNRVDNFIFVSQKEDYYNWELD